MIYLPTLNTKNDAKSIPVFSQLPFCPCPEPSHQNYTLTLICIEKNCPKKGLICTMCQYEHHRQHQNSTIPVKIFLDKYRESFNEFQSTQNKEELKIESIKEIYMETLNILKNFHAKIVSEISTLQTALKNLSEEDIRNFIQEEENNKDPLIKILGMEENCTTTQAMNLISSLMDRIIYKENETMDLESLSFSHTSKEDLLKKFDNIKQKAHNNQEIVRKTFDGEFLKLHDVFSQLESQFSCAKNNKIEEKNEETIASFSLVRFEVFNFKTEWTSYCFLDESLNNHEKLEFLISDTEDNRIYLYKLNQSGESPIIVDLFNKQPVIYFGYCKKLQILVGIDSEYTVFTIKFKNQHPYLLPNWTSHHYKEIFYKSGISMQISGVYLIVGTNNFIYILNITNEGVIEIKVKIEINGCLEFITPGNDENEVFFIWNKQNSLKKIISVLEVDKGIINNQNNFEINYQLKGFAFYKEHQCFLFWGVEFERNKEFLEIMDNQNSQKERFYLEKSLKFMKYDEIKKGVYLFFKNNNLELRRLVKSP